MIPATRVFLSGALAILVLDTVGSLAARLVGFPYAALIPVSFFIQAAVGFFAARTGTLWIGIAVAAAVAAVEATIGWAISWASDLVARLRVIRASFCTRSSRSPS